MLPHLEMRTLVSGLSRIHRSAVGCALAAALAACVSGEASGNGSDKQSPTISLTAEAATDSTVAFLITAGDNLGLLHVDAVAGAPGVSAVCDTTFNTAVTAFTRSCTVSVPAAVPIGTTITVLGQAVDGARNASKVDTLLLVTGGGSPAVVVLTQPKNAPPDTAVVGFSTALSISGKSAQKVKSLGWIVSGVFNPAHRDSVVYNSPLKDSVAQDSGVSFVGAAIGTAVITPFMYDSLGRQFIGPAVNVVVVATAGTGTIPVVNFGITSRIEVADTIHVSATDRAGIASVGYEIDSLSTTFPTPVIATATFPVAGNVNTAVHTFTLALPITNFPTQVLVKAFATNNNGRTDSARTPVGNTGFVRRDTVTVVAGLTKQLPNGGNVADGLYHTPTNRLYLSNIEKNELEVFDVATSSFIQAIPVGSRPWGIAVQPADQTGNQTNTLLVANSGGTLISFVDVTGTPGVEVSRYALPNILFFTVTSAVLPNGQLVEHRTQHDFSDRPQYLAATCSGPGPACGDLVVGYTTTPTAGQTLPFTNQGTIRYENITQRASHFFFEQAIGQGAQAAIDTIEIDRFQAGGFGSDSALVPFLQGPFITGTDTSFFSVTTNTPLIGFRDTTFARNSGNHQRAVFGEGGAVSGVSGQPNARVMTYNAAVGMVTSFTSKGHTYTTASTPAFTPVFDGGISRPGDVSDWIANTSTSVSGVAINFDGATNAVRADSTFLFDVTLRLQGLLQTSGGNAGLDFHPGNFGVPRPGAAAPTQLMFTSSSQAEIDVWNTNYFKLCLVVPTRDPIIGPIKSAALAGGSTLIVGATKFGVVVVTILQAQMTAACP